VTGVRSFGRGLGGVSFFFQGLLLLLWMGVRKESHSAEWFAHKQCVQPGARREQKDPLPGSASRKVEVIVRLRSVVPWHQI
jgi:hypothetical protein